MKKTLLIFLSLIVAGLFSSADVYAQSIVVKKGDNFTKLSMKYDVPVGDLIAENWDKLRHPGNPHWIYPGQVFNVPIKIENVEIPGKNKYVKPKKATAGLKSKKRSQEPSAQENTPVFLVFIVITKDSPIISSAPVETPVQIERKAEPCECKQVAEQSKPVEPADINVQAQTKEEEKSESPPTQAVTEIPPQPAENSQPTAAPSATQTEQTVAPPPPEEIQPAQSPPLAVTEPASETPPAGQGVVTETVTANPPPNENVVPNTSMEKQVIDTCDEFPEIIVIRGPPFPMAKEKSDYTCEELRQLEKSIPTIRKKAVSDQ